jgi:hypothetical protein
MAANRPTSNRRRNIEKEKGMAGSHTPKTSTKHRTAVPDMDTSRKEETREATQHLAKKPRNRSKVDRTNMGAVRTDGKKTGSAGEQSSMAYAPGGAKGVSKVSNVSLFVLSFL